MGYYTRFTIQIQTYTGADWLDIEPKAFWTSMKNAGEVAREPDAETKYHDDYLATNRKLAKAFAKLVKGVGEDGIGYFDAVFFNEGIDTKWYEHVEHMQLLANLFPDHVFVLEGVGEEQFDVWIKVFQKDTPVEAKYVKVSIPVWRNGKVFMEEQPIARR
jgi:hypothetical protein